MYTTEMSQMMQQSYLAWKIFIKKISQDFIVQTPLHQQIYWLLHGKFELKLLTQQIQQLVKDLKLCIFHVILPLNRFQLVVGSGGNRSLVQCLYDTMEWNGANNNYAAVSLETCRLKYMD